MVAIGIQSLLNQWISCCQMNNTVATYTSSRSIIITCRPPATSTSTAKLVRCVLRHCTCVVFPSVWLFLILIPSDSQLPLPALCQRRHTPFHASAQIRMDEWLTVLRNSSTHTWSWLSHSPAQLMYNHNWCDGSIKLYYRDKQIYLCQQLQHQQYHTEVKLKVREMGFSRRVSVSTAVAVRQLPTWDDRTADALWLLLDRKMLISHFLFFPNHASVKVRM